MFARVVRVLVTAVGIALPTLLAGVPLPGVYQELWELAGPDGPRRVHVSIAALGIDAVLLAFVLIELTALIVPRWRALRHGPGRLALMRATFALAAALLVLQAIYASWALRSWGWDLVEAGWGPLLVDAAALLGGSVALLLGARAVSRWGVGHGLSVVVVLGALPAWLDRAWAIDSGRDPEAVARTLVLATIGAVFLVGRRARRERVPVAGLVPLLLPGWVLQVVTLAAIFVPLGSLSWVFSTPPWVTFAVALALMVGLDWLGHRDRSFGALGQRGPALALSAAMLGVIVEADRALDWEVSLFAAGGGVAFFVLAVTVALDVLREAGLHARAELVPILAFSDIDVVDRVGERLAEAEIPFVMRGVGHRTLLRLFGPWVPVRLLVPVELAAEARRIARSEERREDYEEIANAF